MCNGHFLRSLYQINQRNIFYGPYVKHDHGPIRVLKGPQGTTHSVDPERDQNLDPKSRVQKVVPE